MEWSLMLRMNMGQFFLHEMTSYSMQYVDRLLNEAIFVCIKQDQSLFIDFNCIPFVIQRNNYFCITCWMISHSVH